MGNCGDRSSVPHRARRLAIRRIPLQVRKAAAVTGIAVVMTSTFAAAYTVALGRPAPRELPIGVVGPASVTGPIIAGMQQGRNEFDVHDYPTRQSAIVAIDRQTITASSTPPRRRRSCCCRVPAEHRPRAS